MWGKRKSCYFKWLLDLKVQRWREGKQEPSREKRGCGCRAMLISLQLSSLAEILMPSAYLRYSVGIFKSTRNATFSINYIHAAHLAWWWPPWGSGVLKFAAQAEPAFCDFHVWNRTSAEPPLLLQPHQLSVTHNGKKAFQNTLGLA